MQEFLTSVFVAVRVLLHVGVILLCQLEVLLLDLLEIEVIVLVGGLDL